MDKKDKLMQLKSDKQRILEHNTTKFKMDIETKKPDSHIQIDISKQSENPGHLLKEMEIEYSKLDDFGIV